MKKGGIVIASLSSVAGLALILAMVMMIKGFSVAKVEQKARDNTKRNYINFFRLDPFPSIENIEKEEENLENVKQWYDTLLADLRKFNIPATNSNPVVFNGRREAVTAALLADAPVGVDGATVVPGDFSFGFEDYKQGNLANPSDVPRLFRQLSMIELLVREIYAAGVSKILTVSREKFEKTAIIGSETSDFGAARGSRRSRRRGGDSDVIESLDVEQVDPLRDVPVKMDRQRFSFELLANESAIVDMLNRFSRMNLFVVVTKLDVTKAGPDYKLAPDPATEAEAAAKAAGKSGKGTVLAAPNPPPRGRTARLVAGRDLESKLKVLLSVEVYSFDENEEAK